MNKMGKMSKMRMDSNVVYCCTCGRWKEKDSTISFADCPFRVEYGPIPPGLASTAHLYRAPRSSNPGSLIVIAQSPAAEPEGEG